MPSAMPTVTGGDVVRVHHWASAEALVCAAVLIGLGLRIYLPSYVPLGLVPVLATAPVWFLALRRYRGALAFGSLAFIGMVFGLGLTVYAVGAREVTRQGLAKDLGLVLMIVTGVGVVLWGRQLLGRQATAVLVSLGMLAGAGLHLSSGDGNVWKTGLGTPAILLALSLAIRSTRITLLFLAALVAMSLVFDARSQAVILTVCFVLTAWQRRPAVSSGRKALGVAVPGLLLIGLAAYFLGTQALVRGYLGAAAQQRSIQQIDNSGSLILGGRPEIAATLALMKSHVWGYGFGVVPRAADILRAKEGMAAINYDPNNGYVEQYMFGSGFELHSVTGDVWVRMGPPGLLILAVLAVVLVGGLGRAVARRRASGLLLFLVVWTLWNLLFSPLLTAALPLTLAVGLLLPERTRSRVLTSRSPAVQRRTPPG